MRHFAILACAASSVLAGSLPFARYGMLDAPVAGVLEHTQVAVGLGFTAYGYENPDGSNESDFALGGYVEVGLIDRIQLGATYLGAGGFSGQARVLALRESITRPGIAVGVENLIGEKSYEFFEDDSALYEYPQSQNLSAYIVVTKSLDYLAHVPVCLNLGWGSGRFIQEEDSDGFANPIPGLFMAVEIHPSNVFSLAVEWDGRDANFGARYDINRKVSVAACLAEFEQSLRGDDRDQTDVMQNSKFTLAAEFELGPFFNRTTLEPTERLRRTQDEEALRQLEEERRQALQEIEELLRAMEGGSGDAE